MEPCFLDYLFRSVCRTRAVFFAPFCVRDVLYDTLPKLLDSCGFRYPPVPVLEVDISSEERIMVFGEGAGQDELKNLHAVLEGLNVHVSDRRFNYSRALLVVVDRLSRVPVNVERRHCRGAISEYNIGGGPDFFDSAPVDFMVSRHRLLRACRPCATGKNRCVRDDGGDCSRCAKSGTECLAGPLEGVERRRSMHKAVKGQLHTLTALHQYVIVTHGRRLNEQLMAAAHAERLLGYVLANVLPCWNHEVELKLQEYADSVQLVIIENGKVNIAVEQNMGEWWGYESVDAGMTREDRRAIVAPHLGMSDSLDAMLFIDHAMRSPGELFFRDECLLNRSFLPVSVRIMVVVAVVGPARIWVHLGWKKP